MVLTEVADDMLGREVEGRAAPTARTSHLEATLRAVRAPERPKERRP